MGASHSATNLSETLAECDHDILKYVLGQPGSHVKEIFLRFVETQKVVEANNEKETAPGPVMENAAQFSKIFTATNNDHHHWMKLFEVLDTKNDSYVDFYEAISTTVGSDTAFSLFENVVNSTVIIKFYFLLIDIADIFICSSLCFLFRFLVLLYCVGYFVAILLIFVLHLSLIGNMLQFISNDKNSFIVANFRLR